MHAQCIAFRGKTRKRTRKSTPRACGALGSGANRMSYCYRNLETNELVPSRRIGVDAEGRDLYQQMEGYEPTFPFVTDNLGRWLDFSDDFHRIEEEYDRSLEFAESRQRFGIVSESCEGLSESESFGNIAAVEAMLALCAGDLDEAVSSVNLILNSEQSAGQTVIWGRFCAAVLRSAVSIRSASDRVRIMSIDEDATLIRHAMDPVRLAPHRLPDARRSAL